MKHFFISQLYNLEHGTEYTYTKRNLFRYKKSIRILI